MPYRTLRRSTRGRSASRATEEPPTIPGRCPSTAAHCLCRRAGIAGLRQDLGGQRGFQQNIGWREAGALLRWVGSTLKARKPGTLAVKNSRRDVDGTVRVAASQCLPVAEGNTPVGEAVCHAGRMDDPGLFYHSPVAGARPACSRSRRRALWLSDRDQPEVLPTVQSMVFVSMSKTISNGSPRINDDGVRESAVNRRAQGHFAAYCGGCRIPAAFAAPAFASNLRCVLRHRHQAVTPKASRCRERLRGPCIPAIISPRSITR